MNADVLRQRRRSIERDAVELSRHPLRHGRTAGIAEVLGLSDASVRRERTQPKGCAKLRPLMDLILGGDEETARACVTTAIAAWEDRAVLRVETPRLEGRLLHLWHRAEPAADAAEDVAAAVFMGGGCGGAYGEALMVSGSVQLEVRAHVLELEDRGCDVRRLLVRGAA